MGTVCSAGRPPCPESGCFTMMRSRSFEAFATAQRAEEVSALKARRSWADEPQ